MVDADHEVIAEFIVKARKRLEWMDEELARLSDEGDRRSRAGAREELVQMMPTLANGRMQ
jgi:hypothetical protein